MEEMKWDKLSKEELFCIAKYQEARADAFFQVITAWMKSDQPVQYSMSVDSGARTEDLIK